eukprot:4637379-Prymnesium_polylepis.1
MASGVPCVPPRGRFASARVLARACVCARVDARQRLGRLVLPARLALVHVLLGVAWAQLDLAQIDREARAVQARTGALAAARLAAPPAAEQHALPAHAARVCERVVERLEAQLPLELCLPVAAKRSRCRRVSPARARP